jgi:hypothetical protein
MAYVGYQFAKERLKLGILSNGGTLSKHRRKQFAPALPVEVFTFIEERVQQAQTALAPQSPK